MSRFNSERHDSDTTVSLREYQRQFTEYLRNPGANVPLPAVLPQNTAVYARLLHNKIDGNLSNCFPLTRQLLGRARWRRLVRGFIREHACLSPLYREIPDEFIEYLVYEKSAPEYPEFITDLAHYEWMELALETANPVFRGKILPLNGNLLAAVPAINPVMHVLHYRYPVHEMTLSDEFWKKQAVTRFSVPQEIILAGLRDRDYRIQFIRLNPVSARLIELLRDEFRTGEQALMQLALELRYRVPESLLPSGLDMLKQFEAQQIIIGALDGQ
ncbi:MAG: HvfC family RiPP maturation protein [Gammaproteobacteria bacterium]